MRSSPRMRPARAARRWPHRRRRPGRRPGRRSRRPSAGPSEAGHQHASCRSGDGSRTAAAENGRRPTPSSSASSSAPIRAARSGGVTPTLDTDPAGGAEPVGDGLAMEQRLVAARGLDGMAERVAEVQGSRPRPAGSAHRRARARRPGPPRPWPRPPARRARRRRPISKAASVPRAIASPSRLEQLEEALVAEGRHLDRLAEGRPTLSFG